MRLLSVIPVEELYFGRGFSLGSLVQLLEQKVANRAITVAAKRKTTQPGFVLLSFQLVE